jgi:hypothetical protein
MTIWSFSRMQARLSAPHFGEAWGSAVALASTL